MSTPVVVAIVLILSAGGASCSGPAASPPPVDPAVDHAQVAALEQNVALVLANEGFDAYAALFHPDYTNWSGTGAVLDRQAYLARVRPWYDAGNRAVSTEMLPVTIEVIGDLALSRYHLREDFSDGTAFVGRFVSVARRHEGRWTLYRTSFTTVYRGPRAEAPALPPSATAP